MKIRYFFLLAMMLILSWGTSAAQDAVGEKTPSTLAGVWQMCFYRSVSPDVPGELKTSNSLKILSDDGHFTNIVMMQTGAITIGYGDYYLKSPGVYTEVIEKNIHLPQLNGAKNDLHFELKENGNLMYLKYYLATDIDGNQLNTWCHEIWKRVEMPAEYPHDIVR